MEFLIVTDIVSNKVSIYIVKFKWKDLSILLYSYVYVWLYVSSHACKTQGKYVVMWRIWMFIVEY